MFIGIGLPLPRAPPMKDRTRTRKIHETQVQLGIQIKTSRLVDRLGTRRIYRSSTEKRLHLRPFKVLN